MKLTIFQAGSRHTRVVVGIPDAAVVQITQMAAAV